MEICKAVLNSFYLKDLGKANALVSNDDASQALKRYLGLEVPLKRHDILKDTSVLKETISPKIIPPSCWPGPGHHPLVLLQQAAVNLSLSKLKDGDILAVNGPPGTGKTTLLRDIIAGIITKRAEAMCAFNNPDSAFSKREMEDLFYYDIDESLKGYEILIASSNNKAVENISLELPNLKAIASDCNDLRYFNAMSDKYYLYESWGIIAATLGSGSNRNKFLQTFWFDDDCSFSAYLEQAYDHRETIDIKDPNSGKIIGKRKPEIVTKNFSPHSYEDALNKWREARKEFKTALEEVNSKLTELKEVESVFKYLDSLTEDEADLQKLEERLKNNQEIRPGFFARIFRPSKVRAWKKENAALLDTKDKVIKGNEYRQKFGHYIADKKLFSKARQDIHLSSPWCNQAMQSLREKLFVAAIKVHKAFIDAAATPILHNMGKFVEHLSGAGGETLNSISAELWAQFFLVVPCASTTFASVGSMLEKVPPKSFGWLLIDEAGQATPQSAVGAIMRSRRVVVVGDPMQIEPVVTLPNSLTHGICKQFEVKAHIFNAPEASVQTLADLATSYFAEFRGKFGSRRVGVPLLVHRRCADPMFSISNAIAYERLMVNAKRPGSSLIRNYLGDSTWFDIESDSAEKWAKKEGEKLIEILIKINALEQPDLYILSPFANVAYNIREIVMKSGILYQWKIQDPKKWADTRIGTVHAAQGREAEAIIFVLGAPSKSQSGTRNWAGSKPNLLNVAATRAKEVFYVIGNQKLWRDAGVFRELADRI